VGGRRTIDGKKNQSMNSNSQSHHDIYISSKDLQWLERGVVNGNKKK
jgi:hypothetical protein